MASRAGDDAEHVGPPVSLFIQAFLYPALVVRASGATVRILLCSSLCS